MKTKHVLLAAGAGLLTLGQLMAGPHGNSADKGGGQGKGGSGKPEHANKGGGGEKGNPSKGGPQADGNDKDKSNKPDQGKFAKHAKGTFRDEDYDIFRSYFEPFRGEPMNLPPGIAKQLRDGKGLPPGWREQFLPGNLLGDPYWDAMVPLPHDLRGRLPRGDDSRYYLIDGQLVRVHPTERRVLGMFALADFLLP
jgi:hypothetical protein